MKSVTTAMDAHLKQGATTLTTCWIITRTDGQTFYYTELDEDVTFEGNVYKSAAGFNKSAITSSASFAVDKMEVTGFLRDDGITDEEIRNGAFDHAQVEVFLVNYMSPGMGKIRLRTGWFGEVRTTGSGAFLVELRGLVDQLQVKIGGTYLPECAVDLGSPKCGIQLQPKVRQGGSNYAVGARVLWPVEAAGYISSRHFPDLVDPNVTTGWPTVNNVVEGDLNVTPYRGPKMVMIRATSLVTTVSKMTAISDMGLLPEEITSGNFKFTFRGKYYRYNAQTSGRIEIRQYRATGNAIVTDTVQIADGLPTREWVDAEVSSNIHPEATRIAVYFGCNPDPAGVLETRFCWDDLDLIVSYREEQIDNFAMYGGVEFQCIQPGFTATVAPDFDPLLGSQTADGEVIWQAVEPRYTHLRTLTETMTSTTTVMIDPISLPWPNYLDWGVMKFLTGKNAGRAMEISGYNQTTGQVDLVLPLPYQGMVGDKVRLQAGCNKTVSNCKLFNNVLNFRGHPRVPGQGQYFKVAGM